MLDIVDAQKQRHGSCASQPRSDSGVEQRSFSNPRFRIHHHQAIGENLVGEGDGSSVAAKKRLARDIIVAKRLGPGISKSSICHGRHRLRSWYTRRMVETIFDMSSSKDAGTSWHLVELRELLHTIFRLHVKGPQRDEKWPPEVLCAVCGQSDLLVHIVGRFPAEHLGIEHERKIGGRDLAFDLRIPLHPADEALRVEPRIELLLHQRVVNP